MSIRRDKNISSSGSDERTISMCTRRTLAGDSYIG